MTNWISLVFLAAVLAALPAGADDKRHPPAAGRSGWAERYQDARHGPEVTDRYTRTARIGRAGSFDLSNVSGDVVITGGPGEDVKVEATKRVRQRDGEAAKSLLEELRIEATELPNRLEIRTLFPRRAHNWSGSVDYTVTVPVGATVSVKTISGDLRVTNVRGELRVETVSGDIVTSGAARLASVKTVSGDVQVSDAGGGDLVSVGSVSGSITARGLKAKAIEAGSISGDIVLDNLTCERVHAKVVSGNVDYSGPLVRTGRYEFSSHSGDVRLVIGKTSGFELEATTFNGDVRSDFPLALRSGNATEHGRNRRGPFNRSIRGSFGDAGAILMLKSFNGDIAIVKR